MARSFPRRRFLAGAGALAGGAVAGLTGYSRLAGSASARSQPQLVGLYSPDHVIAAAVPQRIPFAVVDIGELDVAEAANVPVTVSLDGEVVSESTVSGRVVQHDHGPDVAPDHQHSDLLRYFALRTELPEPGIYDLEVDFGHGQVGNLPVQAFDPADIDVVLPGQPMPPLDTPTTDHPEGISPLCSRQPACPMHAVSVAGGLRSGGPLALLVATPALCRTGYCGPVVDTLVAESAAFPGITAIHLEVYANASEVAGNYDDPAIELAAPVVELGLAFEPSLFLVDAAGTVVDRIDNVFDAGELRAALQTLA